MTFRFVLPAVEEQHVKTLVVDRKLMVSGRRDAPSKLAYCAFERTIELQDGRDTNRLGSKLHDGVLDVRSTRVAREEVRRFLLEARKAAPTAAGETSEMVNSPFGLAATARAVTV